MTNSIAVRRWSVAIFLLAMTGLNQPAFSDVENGKQLYQTLCSQCHGITGEGNGINAPHLEVAPRNHTDAGEMTARTDEELLKAISEGGQAVNKSVLMPNWGSRLADSELQDLISYLRQLCCEK